jgi:hypothetical protein
MSHSFKLHHFITANNISPNQRKELIRGLIKAGADANEADANGDTPLHLAVERLDSESVRVLLAHGGADIDGTDAQGRPPIARMPFIDAHVSKETHALVLDTLKYLCVAMRPTSWPLNVKVAADGGGIDEFVDNTFAPDAPRALRCDAADMLTFVRGTAEPTPACCRHRPFVIMQEPDIRVWEPVLRDAHTRLCRAVCNCGFFFSIEE